MKFTPKQLSGNVNVSRTHPLVELFWLLAGIVMLGGLFIFALGFTTDWAARKAPLSIEKWIGRQTLKQFPGEDNPALSQRLQALLTTASSEERLQRYPFRILVLDRDDVNALALPGGTIVIFSGLLDEITSENELMMVIGHELGHFAQRDHLRGLGRGLGIAIATTMIFGQDSGFSDLVAKAVLPIQAGYSQQQERAADRFALDLLARHYGHCGGATDFFVRHATTSGPQIAYLLASHPHPQARIDDLNRIIASKHYTLLAPQPLGEDLRHRQSDPPASPTH